MRPHLPSFVEAVGHGIHAIDTGFHRDRFDAAWLLVHGGRAAFIDTGTNFAVPRLLEALEALGLAPADVDWVIPTHVHLDHAGGAGALMRELPVARLLVHPRGQRHLVDPTALVAGALQVYGPEEMARSYGRIVPVPAERTVTSHDGMAVELAGRVLRLIDTPGHARHHHCVWDAASRGWFTGDTFGLSYREFDVDGRPWLLPTSTPVQFEPPALADSVRRIAAGLDGLVPEQAYLTHFGRVRGVPALAERFLVLLDGMVEVALGARAEAGAARHAALKAGLEALHRDSLRRHGCSLPAAEVTALLALDVELNAQGIGIWLDRAG